jgi:hypothetical protein
LSAAAAESSRAVVAAIVKANKTPTAKQECFSDSDSFPDMQPVVISYPTLLSAPDALLPAIGDYSPVNPPIVFNPLVLETAFGSDPDSLGIIILRDLPREYEEHRSKLLKLAYKFGQLDYNVREGYSDPSSKYRCVHKPPAI